MVVVVTSRKTLPFARQCVDSVRWRVGPEAVDLVYLDDASGYDTTDLAALRTEVEIAGGTFLHSRERLYQLAALNRLIGQI